MWGTMHLLQKLLHLYFVYCILYIVYCILYPVSCIMYHVSCILYPVSCKLYYVIFILYFLFLFFLNFSHQQYLNWSSFCHALLFMNVFRSCIIYGNKIFFKQMRLILNHFWRNCFCAPLRVYNHNDDEMLIPLFARLKSYSEACL